MEISCCRPDPDRSCDILRVGLVELASTPLCVVLPLVQLAVLLAGPVVQAVGRPRRDAPSSCLAKIGDVHAATASCLAILALRSCQNARATSCQLPVVSLPSKSALTTLARAFLACVSQVQAPVSIAQEVSPSSKLTHAVLHRRPFDGSALSGHCVVDDAHS